jgi:hypothetical protein
MAARSTIKLKLTGLESLNRDLTQAGLKLSDLNFQGVANQGMRLAAAYAPRRTGKLAASLRASAGKSGASIRAGGARAPYAGPINYGWRARRIAPAGFMERADAVLRRTVPSQLEAQARRIIAGRGLA